MRRSRAVPNSDGVYSWPELQARLAACTEPFVLGVVRHGQTEANAARRFSGATDVRLSEQGEREARELGFRLTGTYDLAFHSPLSRSRRTLELALSASQADVVEVLEDERLAERSLGVLEGLDIRPIPEYAAGDFNYAPEGGEPYASVARRVLSFLADLGAAAGAERERPLRALACTHVGPMRVLVPVLEGATDGEGILTARYANAEITSFALSRLAVPEFLADVLSEV
jgi:2,3-bisphosphoglycerate-dependent phosphoglycerate mutase